MPFWKSLLLHLYYHGSYPLRRWRNRAAAAAGRAPVMVLFYHRVASDAPNAWTCSPQNFLRQIRWLRRHFDIISLDEAQRRIRSGVNRRPSVSITFDDGYADNCREALPFLIRENIPCTYFVATRYVFEGRPFPHDVHAGRRLEPNTVAQLHELAAAGVEIGAHTRTHADLGKITDSARLYDEIVGSAEELASALGRPIRYFAFPFGQIENLSAAAFEIARDAGFEGVCSAYGGFNFPGDDAFHLQRIHADNDLIRLKNWTTVDPRKQNAPRFQERPPSTDRTGVGVNQP